jgi:GT2 family glycosyltransferase
VLIPTKDRPWAVIDAVRSVFNGTYQRFEIFVVDQSADDATREALQEFASDPRFHYLQNRRLGFGAASSRNMGIALSSGEIIAITDDDVEVRPDWIERIASEFQADPQLDFIAGRLTAPPYDPATGFTPSFNAGPWVTRHNMALHVSGANFSMRRRLFDKVGGYDEFCGPGSRLRASDDTDLCHRILRSGAKVKLCPEIEVVHTHGFRGNTDAEALYQRYSYGNGGNYGRFTRRGDLRAGAWFLGREGRNLGRAVANGLRGRGWKDLTYSYARLRGFWHGFTLPPGEGFVSGEQLKRLRADFAAIIAGERMARHQINS